MIPSSAADLELLQPLGRSSPKRRVHGTRAHRPASVTASRVPVSATATAHSRTPITASRRSTSSASRRVALEPSGSGRGGGKRPAGGIMPCRLTAASRLLPWHGPPALIARPEAHLVGSRAAPPSNTRRLPGRRCYRSRPVVSVSQGSSRRHAESLRSLRGDHHDGEVCCSPTSPGEAVPPVLLHPRPP